MRWCSSRCARATPIGCASPAALQFLAIVDAAKARDGRARLGEINRAINLAIRPMGDLAQYGEIDVWSSPLATLTRGAGDCEDYAIAKFVALQRAGISPDDLRIVIMRDTIRGEDHAVAAARLDGHWLTLDNRRMAMVEDAHVRNYRPSLRASIATASDATRRRRCRCSASPQPRFASAAAIPESKPRRCTIAARHRLRSRSQRCIQGKSFCDIAVHPELRALHFVWRKLWRQKFSLFALRFHL